MAPIPQAGQHADQHHADTGEGAEQGISGKAEQPGEEIFHAEHQPQGEQPADKGAQGQKQQHQQRNKPVFGHVDAPLRFLHQQPGMGQRCEQT
ncbi:hypothetical protein D3C76_1539660 [compost metagenome]